MAKQLLDTLKDRGYRLTPQRAIILEALEGLSGHLTAEDVFEAVQKTNPYISLATIYRTLDLLEELGLVVKSNMGTATASYAIHTHNDHHHAVCRVCERVIELPHDFFQGNVDKLRTDYNFIADTKHVVVFGWCAACHESL